MNRISHKHNCSTPEIYSTFSFACVFESFFHSEMSSGTSRIVFTCALTQNNSSALNRSIHLARIPVYRDASLHRLPGPPPLRLNLLCHFPANVLLTSRDVVRSGFSRCHNHSINCQLLLFILQYITAVYDHGICRNDRWSKMFWWAQSVKTESSILRTRNSSQMVRGQGTTL
jgi:hypothetical protein